MSSSTALPKLDAVSPEARQRMEPKCHPLKYVPKGEDLNNTAQNRPTHPKGQSYAAGAWQAGSQGTKAL